MMNGDQENHVDSAKRYRAQAAELSDLVRTTRSLKQGGEARKRQKAYTALAENEEWLAENADKLADARTDTPGVKKR
jgi:hypothetical protein